MEIEVEHSINTTQYILAKNNKNNLDNGFYYITLMLFSPSSFVMAVRISPGPLHKDPLQQYILEGIRNISKRVEGNVPDWYFKHWENTIAF